MDGRYSRVAQHEDATVEVESKLEDFDGQRNSSNDLDNQRDAGSQRDGTRLPLNLIARISDYCDEHTVRKLTTASVEMRALIEERYGSRRDRTEGMRTRRKHSALGFVFAIADALLWITLPLCLGATWWLACQNAEPNEDVGIARVSQPMVAWCSLTAVLLVLQWRFTTATVIGDTPGIEIATSHLEMPVPPCVRLASALCTARSRMVAETFWLLLAAVPGERTVIEALHLTNASASYSVLYLADSSGIYSNGVPRALSPLFWLHVCWLPEYLFDTAQQLLIGCNAVSLHLLVFAASAHA